MDSRIDPVLPRFGIAGIGGERQHQRGGKNPFEDALDKEGQRDANRGTEDSATISGTAPAPPPATGLQDAEGAIRKDASDDTPHVDVIV